MPKFWQVIKLWLPVFVWAGVIFTFSSMPDLKSGLEEFWDFVFRKIAHMAEFMVLFVLLARAFGIPPHQYIGGGGIRKKWSLLWALIISILYACSDEYHQLFVFGREGCIKDVGFDTVGVLIGYLLVKRAKH